MANLKRKAIRYFPNLDVKLRRDNIILRFHVELDKIWDPPRDAIM